MVDMRIAAAPMRTKVSQLMLGVIDALEALVSIPSVSFPGYPSEPVHRMADATVDLLRRSGASDARLLEVPDGYPAVYAEVAGPPGAPTVLLYAHYDVQPAPLEQGWTTDPWTPTTKDDGRIYGRGAADDKSGIVIHAGVLQAFDGKPPVTLKILIEGEEETVSHLDGLILANPDLVRADAIVIADMGNPSVGVPALTTALRGEVACTLKVRTLHRPLHSGLFGGAAPDALIALSRMIATLHDDEGNTAVAGLEQFEWPGADVEEDNFRANAATVGGIDLIGSGSLASRLWSKPSVSVIGIDAPTVAASSNVLIPEATAKISLRIPPGADGDTELQTLMDHLRHVAPWNAEVDVQPVRVGKPFAVEVDHPAVHAASEALGAAYGVESTTIGSGGSIPLVALLQELSPSAGVILWGAEDTAGARIHASDESVDPSEIERTIVAEALLLQKLGS